MISIVVPLNVSFGILAFLPMGWLFMVFIIFCEAFLMSKYLTDRRFNKRIYLSATAANVISGAVGIITTMAINGGWWLVVWFPWVSSNEVNVGDPRQLLSLAVYYLTALILSVLIELGINFMILRRRYRSMRILIATLRANAFSYILGALLIIISICF